MAIKGIEIFKLLPKKNCKECDLPSCLTFAIQLAEGEIEAKACPHLSYDIINFLSNETKEKRKFYLENGVNETKLNRCKK